MPPEMGSAPPAATGEARDIKKGFDFQQMLSNNRGEYKVNKCAAARPPRKVIPKKLQRDLLAAHEFVKQHVGISAECIAFGFHTPFEQWMAALLREAVPDDRLLTCFNTFLRQAERDRVKWRRTHGRITLAIVGRGADMQVVAHWSPA